MSADDNELQQLTSAGDGGRAAAMVVTTSGDVKSAPAPDTPPPPVVIGGPGGIGTDDEAQRSSSSADFLNPKTSSFGERPQCFKNTLQEAAFVFQATNATAASSFFQGASAIVTVSIGRDLAMTQGQISWITASTALTAGAFQLGLGQLADLLGRKATFIIGMGSFGALCLLAAFAQNPYWMDIMCGLIGISSAMVVPPAIGIMGAAYGRPSR
jgi:hypothetical protein